MALLLGFHGSSDEEEGAAFAMIAGREGGFYRKQKPRDTGLRPLRDARSG